MKFLVDENMPRNLAADISEIGFQAQDVRDVDNKISVKVVTARILDVIQNRLPSSLLGAYTTVELRRALSRPVRSR